MQLMCFVVTFSLGPRILGAAGLGGLGSFLASWGAVSYHGHDI